jgi:hypothetical protein
MNSKLLFCVIVVSLLLGTLDVMKAISLPQAEGGDHARQPTSQHSSEFDSDGQGTKLNLTKSDLAKILSISGTPQEESALWITWSSRVCAASTAHLSMAEKVIPLSMTASCVIRYTVTRDGRVLNVRMVKPSKAVAFDALVQNAVGLLTRDKVLQFPSGSSRTSVEILERFSYSGHNDFTVPVILADPHDTKARR